MSESGLIRFICVHPRHAERDGHKDHLTISGGAWAFCPRDSTLKGHVWEPTGGLSMDDVMRSRRGHETPREVAS